MHIGFLLETAGKGRQDCRLIFEGNPGIGGAEYEFILISSALTAWDAKQDEITVFTNGQYLLPNNLNVVSFSEEDELFNLCKKYRVEVLVLDSRQNFNVFKALSRLNMTLIPWAHCFMSFRQLNRFARLKSVARIVCVGREQLDLYRDHAAFQKSVFIYNAVFISNNIKSLALNSVFSQRPLEVAYVGSLTPDKGFHLLARAWKNVLAVYPEAILHVIGSGKLYFKNARLGTYGIADQSYEDSFMKYLTDHDGNVLSSVRFHGVLGQEKYEILSRCKVAIPNPSGRTETFGLVAVEMQLSGCLVATKRCPGFMDTVCSTGILYDNENELASSIIKLLTRSDNYYERTYLEIEQNFSFDKVLLNWLDLFEDLKSGTPIRKSKSLENLFFRYKWLREMNRNLRRFFPILPPLCAVEELLARMKRFNWGKR